MAYRYSRSEPKWTQATSVKAATPDGSYVNVTSTFGNGYEFKMCKVGWNNKFMDKSKSDVTVETKEYGWLRIWFHNADIQPYEATEDKDEEDEDGDGDDLLAEMNSNYYRDVMPRQERLY